MVRMNLASPEEATCIAYLHVQTNVDDTYFSEDTQQILYLPANAFTVASAM